MSKMKNFEKMPKGIMILQGEKCLPKNGEVGTQSRTCGSKP